MLTRWCRCWHTRIKYFLYYTICQLCGIGEISDHVWLKIRENLPYKCILRKGMFLFRKWFCEICCDTGIKHSPLSPNSY